MSKHADEPARCPICALHGGLVARKDAYVNFSIPLSGRVNWNETSDVTVFDDTTFECTFCSETFAKEKIEAANNFRIN